MGELRGVRSRPGIVAILVLLAVVGCGGGGDGDDSADTTVAPEDSSAVSAAEVAAPTTLATTTTTEPPPLTLDDTVTTAGLGEIRIGMTVGEAEVAGGRLLDSAPGADEQTCYEVTPRDMPGVELVVVEGRIRVVDVTVSQITTRSGAAVGMATEELVALFGDRLDDTPVDGTPALTFVPVDEADQGSRVVFLTDGSKVTRMLSGTLPHVLRVDPCADGT